MNHPTTDQAVTREMIEELKALSRRPEHRAHELHAWHCFLTAQAWGELFRASEAVARAIRSDDPRSDLIALMAARDAKETELNDLLRKIDAERASLS